MIRKLILSDGRSERELILKGTLVVGRDPSCHVNDLDPLLSRRHAEFVSGRQGVMVRDLGSRNGILVNGVKVPQQLLVPGDIVQLGHLELRYIEDSPVQSVEQHTRAHATTAPGIDPPTMMRLPRSQGSPRSIPAVAEDDDDQNETRALIAKCDHSPSTPPAPSASGDFDATVAPSAMASAGALGATANNEARIVVDRSLIVTEATGSCTSLLGIRPETVVGGQLTEALAQALSFVASGSGPSPLALSVARGKSGGSLTITFKAG
jgi:FHA domain-containing protein